jgi:hypothetical protein
MELEKWTDVSGQVVMTQCGEERMHMTLDEITIRQGRLGFVGGYRSVLRYAACRSHLETVL